MIHRLKNLIAKLMRQMLTKAENQYESHRDPVEEMQGTIREIEAEIQKLEEQYVDVRGQKYSHEHDIKEYKSNIEEMKSQLKKAKQSDDMERANRFASRIARMEDVIERLQSAIDQSQSSSEQIANMVENLQTDKQDIEFEIKITKTQNDAAKIDIDQSQRQMGHDTGLGQNAQEVMESARQKIRDNQNRAKAYQDAVGEFKSEESNETEKTSGSLSDRAKRILEEA